MSTIIKSDRADYTDSTESQKYNKGGTARAAASSNVLKAMSLVLNTDLLTSPPVSSAPQREIIKAPLITISGDIKPNISGKNTKEHAGEADDFEPDLTDEKPEAEGAPAKSAQEILSDAEAESGRIIAQAESKAAQILADAKKEAGRMSADAEMMVKAAIDSSTEKAMAEYDSVLKRAHELGYTAGYEEAMVSVTGRSEQKLSELSAIISDINDKKAKILKKYERDIIELSVAIAQKIIGQEVKLDKKVITGIFKETISENRNEAWIKVTVSERLDPLQVTVDSEIAELIASMGPNVTVAVARGVKEGLCLVETPGGIINLSLDTQLDNIGKSIRETHMKT